MRPLPTFLARWEWLQAYWLEGVLRCEDLTPIFQTYSVSGAGMRAWAPTIWHNAPRVMLTRGSIQVVFDCCRLPTMDSSA